MKLELALPTFAEELLSLKQRRYVGCYNYVRYLQMNAKIRFVTFTYIVLLLFHRHLFHNFYLCMNYLK